MALIETEMTAELFGKFVSFIASSGPIPVGVVSGLGNSRLISAFSWNLVQVGAAPPGFVVPTGKLTASCAVTLQHVSTAELDVNPRAAGTSTPATAWLLIIPSPSNIQLRLLAIQIPGTPLQWFTPPVLVGFRSIPATPGSAVQSAAIVLADDVVTLRLSTNTTDDLLFPPLNQIKTAGGDTWGIRLSGDLFTGILLQQLAGVIAKPPSGTSVEDAPSAYWGEANGSWAAIGNVGLLKKDACPGLFGDVDLSIAVDIVLTPSTTLNPPPPQTSTLDLTLTLSSDVSDWDSFRCWLGNGGIGSLILAYIAPPLIGVAGSGLTFVGTGIASGIAIGETLRLEAGNQIKGTDVATFQQTSSSSTSATYFSQLPLPTLAAPLSNGRSIGTTNAAVVGPNGVFISGQMTILNCVHVVSFIPDGGTLVGRLKNKFECGKKTWVRRATIDGISITDEAQLLNTRIAQDQVTIFPSSVGNPANLFSIEIPHPDIAQFATITCSDLAKAGSSGRFYLHTSAGIRRYDIPPINDVKAPTPKESIDAVAKCLKNEKIFTPQEKIHWLVDPPALIHENENPYLRQWLFSFERLEQGAQVGAREAGPNAGNQQHTTLTAAHEGSGFFEVITGPSGDVTLNHNQADGIPGRILQRWLAPVHVIPLKEQGGILSRSGSTITVTQQHSAVNYDLGTGQTTHHATGQTSYQAVKQNTNAATTTFSLSLPGGRIAAIHGDKLIIAVPASEVLQY